MPAETAAEVEHSCVSEIRKQRPKIRPFLRAVQTLCRTRHAAVLREKLGFVVYILLHTELLIMGYAQPGWPVESCLMQTKREGFGTGAV